MIAHSTKWLTADAELVASLLETAAGKLYGSDGIEQDDLTTDKYESLTRIVDLSVASSAVRELRKGAAPPEDFPVLRYSAAPQPTDPVILDQHAWQEHHMAAFG